MSKSPRSLPGHTTIQLVTSILGKDSQERTSEENSQLVQFLGELEYFKNHINSSSERKEVLEAATEFFGYSYYAKGTAVCHQGDLPDFGVILQGKALVYEPKAKEELDVEQSRAAKSACFEYYREYVKQYQPSRKAKRTQTVAGSLVARSAFSKGGDLLKSKDVKTLNTEDDFVEQKGPSINYIENILKSENGIIPKELKYDLSIDEKYLFLISFDGVKSYFKDGKAVYKKRKECEVGDSIGDIALTTVAVSEYTIVAAEDLYLLTIEKDCFPKLFQTKITNLQKKKKFFTALFPTIPYEIIVNLCLYVEEEVHSIWDYIYEDGDKSDAIYIVKSGEVQLEKPEDEKPEKLEKPENFPASFVLTEKSKGKFRAKGKLIVGGVEVGGIFGEEEIIRKTDRKYSARCNGTATFLYVIKREIYTDIIDKYMPLVSKALKLSMTSKATWRRQRIEIGQRIATEIQHDDGGNPDSREHLATMSDMIIGETAKKRSPIPEENLMVRSDSDELKLSFPTRNAIEATVYKIRETKKQSTPKGITFKPRNANSGNTSISPRSDTKPSPAEEIQNLKSSLFKQNQRNMRKYTGTGVRSVYMSPEARPVTTKQVARPTSGKITITSKSPKLVSQGSPLLTSDKTTTNSPQSQSQTQAQILSINIDKVNEYQSRRRSAFFQIKAGFSPNSAQPSPSHADNFKTAIKNSLMESTKSSLTPNLHFSSNSAVLLEIPNISEPPMSLSSRGHKPSKYSLMDVTQKGTTLQQVQTTSGDIYDSLEDLGVAKFSPEQAVAQKGKTKSFSQISKIFALNKGHGEPKIAVVRAVSPKQGKSDGESDSEKKTNKSRLKVVGNDRNKFRKRSLGKYELNIGGLL